MTNTSKKPTPSARELIADRQRRQKPAGKEPGKELKIVGKEPAVARTDDEYRSRYLDEIAPDDCVGRRIKYSPKDAAFVFDDDGQEVPNGEFAALCDQTWVGRVKFNGAGVLPDKKGGLLYAGFRMPLDEELTDRDQSKWEIGLDGEPEDPWQHFMYLPLQEVKTQALATFVTSSKTGRRAVGDLLKHYDRMCKTDPGTVPVIWLRSSGFQHKDSRVGWVNKPMFVPCGRRPADSVAQPDTSTAGILNDDIPDFDEE